MSSKGALENFSKICMEALAKQYPLEHASMSTEFSKRVKARWRTMSRRERTCFEDTSNDKNSAKPREKSQNGAKNAKKAKMEASIKSESLASPSNSVTNGFCKDNNVIVVGNNALGVDRVSATEAQGRQSTELRSEKEPVVDNEVETKEELH